MAPAGPDERPDELVNPFTGQRIRFVSETDELLVMESSYEPGGAPAPPHLHPSQDERFEVLSGGVGAAVDGREMTLREGDELVVPADTPHVFGGLPDEAGTVRWEVRPALRTRAFFEALFAGLQAAADEQAGRPPGPGAGFDVADWADVIRPL